MQSVQNTIAPCAMRDSRVPARYGLALYQSVQGSAGGIRTHDQLVTRCLLPFPEGPDYLITLVENSICWRR